MKKLLLPLIILISCVNLFSQTKVSGKIVDVNGKPIAYANVLFRNSIIGLVTNEKGEFYIESDKSYDSISVSFIGFETKIIALPQKNNYNLTVVLNEELSTIKEVVLYSGKQKKKGNPAIKILNKVLDKKKRNGLYLYDQYEFNSYEKIEFDLNNIDSTLMKSKVFKGMEFIFNHVDTSKVTGKSYLPIFINEALYKTYGNNKPAKKREDLIANKNSGFESNQYIISSIKALYVNYDIYDSYIKLFNKSFVSPISKVGIDTYNYVLADSSYIDSKWCYKIVYYPKQKGTLTFKGDFWVNDSTFAIKEINMSASKSVNINWVKELYIEQAFDVLNDSVFLLKKDHILTDFSISKKEKKQGLYGKRTTLYSNYTFDKEKPLDFYAVDKSQFDEIEHKKSAEFWDENRTEALNNDELGVYKMLDTLQTVPKFKTMHNLAIVLASGYIEFPNFDFGPIFSTFGFNDVEGTRIRVGGRTYFGQNDTWRLQGYTAYGTKDENFKYGLSAKWMINSKNRFIVSVGKRYDVEQTGVSLTTVDDVLGRSFASSALLASGDSSKLTQVDLTTFSLSMNLNTNFQLKLGSSYRNLESASEVFKLNYLDSEKNEQTKTTQLETSFSIKYTPFRKTVGRGVERSDFSSRYPTFYLNYRQGIKNWLQSDFDYQKIQFYYNQPFQIGGLGASSVSMEVGKTLGNVPLTLLSVVPGNQSYLSVDNAYGLLNYYEFVTDTYASVRLFHNFNGRFFNYIPLVKKLNLRELVSVKSVYGTVSQENKALNKSSIQTYTAPEKGYIEYSAGIGNIFKVFKVEFLWRGTYRDLPNSNNFGVKGSFGFSF